jgi:hypothetical protein
MVDVRQALRVGLDDRDVVGNSALATPLTPVTMTRWPRAWSSSAAALPMPLVPLVIRAAGTDEVFL